MTVDTFSTFILADDHPLIRRGVRMVLESELAPCKVVEAADLDATLAALTNQPDALLLIDLDMPGMDGIESLRALRQGFPSLQMAVLSGNAETCNILKALRAGVNGYIVKATSPDELLHAIATIRSGRVYLAQALPNLWDRGTELQTPRTEEVSPQHAVPLTPRQREVIAHLMKGHSNKQIARALNIGEGTVKVHLAAVFRVLGAQNRTEAVMRASRLGL